MAAPSLVEVLRRIGKVEHDMKQLQKRFDSLTERFALYWFDERKPPAFAIVLSRFGDEATLFIVTEHLGKADITFNKPLLKGGDLVKTGKWEPLVLPKEILDLLAAKPAKEEPAEKEEELASDETISANAA